jgi:hypothetical protein
MKWLADKMASWKNGKLTICKVNEMASLQNAKYMKSQVDEMQRK